MPSGLTTIGASSSGRTSRFERENPGSNPGAPATRECRCHVDSAARVLACLARSHGFESRTWRHFSCDVSSVGTERRFAMPEVEGSTPSRRTNQRDPSPAANRFSALVAHSILLGSRLNGRTADSDSANVGSTPTFPAQPVSMVALAQSVRAPGCELGGCGFEPRTSPQNSRDLAQPARASALGAGGRGFESRSPDQFQRPLSSTLWSERSIDNREVVGSNSTNAPAS
jgi:hypothetical protein